MGSRRGHQTLTGTAGGGPHGCAGSGGGARGAADGGAQRLRARDGGRRVLPVGPDAATRELRANQGAVPRRLRCERRRTRSGSHANDRLRRTTNEFTANATGIQKEKHVRLPHKCVACHQATQPHMQRELYRLPRISCCQAARWRAVWTTTTTTTTTTKARWARSQVRRNTSRPRPALLHALRCRRGARAGNGGAAAEAVAGAEGAAVC